MAAESLIGGGAGELTPGTIALLDNFLLDSVGGSAVTTDLGNGAILVTATGGNGELQGAVVSDGVAVAAEVNAGAMTLAVSLPAGVGIAFETPPSFATAAEIKTFFQTQIDAALPSGGTDAAVDALNLSLTTALNNIIDALATQGADFATISVIGFADDSGSGGVSNNESFLGNEGFLVSTSAASPEQTIVFDASGAANNEVFALLLNQINADNALQLKGVENAILVGGGTVSVGDNTNVNLQGDLSNQLITGGGGNDTLVGGGGNDTLIGGAGDDVIGFNALGNYTVQLDLGSDKLAFQFDGINSIDDLIPFITNVTQANGNVTYEFVDGAATITLVGVSVDEVTADMVIFTL